MARAFPGSRGSSSGPIRTRGRTPASIAASLLGTPYRRSFPSALRSNTSPSLAAASLTLSTQSPTGPARRQNGRDEVVLSEEEEEEEDAGGTKKQWEVMVVDKTFGSITPKDG